jgi:hypothetical protein
MILQHEPDMSLEEKYLALTWAAEDFDFWRYMKLLHNIESISEDMANQSERCVE